jgi:DNA-3-methyladenine glycosylase I
LLNKPSLAELKRCPWAGESDALYIKYHDEEWGVPVHDDRKMFEFLVLESAQAGLSWITVLRKRENYKKAFANFDAQRVAKFGERELGEMLQNPGLIRNRQKLSAAINNAQKFLEVQKEFGSFCNYLWGFVDNKPIINKWRTLKQLPAKTKLAEEISADLKRRGFKFLGPTTIYAHLQATGLVNDHLVSCFKYRA